MSDAQPPLDDPDLEELFDLVPAEEPRHQGAPEFKFFDFTDPPQRGRDEELDEIIAAAETQIASLRAQLASMQRVRRSGRLASRSLLVVAVCAVVVVTGLLIRPGQPEPPAAPQTIPGEPRDPSVTEAVPTTSTSAPPAASLLGQRGWKPAVAIARPKPAYPAPARQRGEVGAVEVDVRIDAAGRVVAARAVSGPPALRGAAEAGVRRWRYQPAVENGAPVESRRRETVTFP